MKKMKTAKIFISLAMLTAIYGTASAQISPFVSAQVDAAAKPCADIAGASAGLPEAQAKAVAIAALEPCYEALQTLDAFEKSNGAGLTAEERNYFYYVGGNVIWMTAASETMKNDGFVTQAICNQVQSAEVVWGNVKVTPGSQVDIDMRTNALRGMLGPVCQAAR